MGQGENEKDESVELMQHVLLIDERMDFLGLNSIFVTFCLTHRAKACSSKVRIPTSCSIQEYTPKTNPKTRSPVQATFVMRRQEMFHTLVLSTPTCYNASNLSNSERTRNRRRKERYDRRSAPSGHYRCRNRLRL